jgi:hypothetical protein
MIRKLIAGTIALLLLALAMPLLLPPPAAVREAAHTGLPWQIDRLEDARTRVFGLTPGLTLLSEAEKTLGTDYALAIVAAPDELGTLEAYFERAQAGFVTGKMVLTLDVAPDTLTTWKDRALKREPMQSTTRKHTLTPDDAAAARQARIVAIAFVPSVNLEANTAVERFGPPEERVMQGEASEHLLYPALGLDVTINSTGKEVLQYVAPDDFERLRAPLR